VSTVAIIPGRGNSQRIPAKNIRMFHGKPIIAYSIQTAQESGIFDKIVVSTDCVAIAEVARQYGAEVFERPFDDGTRGTQEVAREVLLSEKYADATMACVIYATSPLLGKTDLRNAEHALIVHRANYVMSVRSDVLADAGCFYMGRANAFIDEIPLIGRRTVMYPLPPERCCDINTMDDLARAEQLYQRLQEGK